MLWEELREEEFEDALEKCGKVCVIPMGCIEKHGQHLPVGTDTYISESIAIAASELEEFMIFKPGFWFGEVAAFHADKNPSAVRRMGNIAMKPETILNVLEELCDEIARNGFNKILIVNSHGGNVHLLNHFLRCQTYEDKPYSTMWTWNSDYDKDMLPDELLKIIESRRDDFPMITEEDMETLRQWAPRGWGGGHADFTETALVMADRPDLIASDRYESENGERQTRIDPLALCPNYTRPEEMRWELSIANAWYATSPNCYTGHPPHGCSVGIGQAMKKISIERLADMIKRIKESDDIYNVVCMDRNK